MCLFVLQSATFAQSLNEEQHASDSSAICDPLIEINSFVPDKEPSKIVLGPKACVSEDEL